MQSHIGHIQFNVEAANLPFYRDLAAFLGWQTLYDTDEFIGVADPSGTSLWFIGHIKPANNDYDGPGMNHLGFSVPAQADVDAAAAFLTTRKIDHLFETPRHRPEFAHSGETTYYQVMFESPDRILFEIVYTGPKNA
jgi:catechol 2,3-dioxygenase-like lactoylglutathione lyase family enzyme